ncbi:TPA: helix-turn-helix transcriptional regulator [Raoultella planticola]
MRNIAVNDVDHLPRRVLALGSDYPANTQLPRHSHRRAQFLYAMNGLMKVETDDGHWLVPPYSGVWIPATKPHRVWMPGVSTHSLYIEPEAAPRADERCEVVQVSPLLHQLLLSACQLPLLYNESGHDAALIELVLHELKAASPLPMFTPLPQNAQLAALCGAFLQQPDIHSAPQRWAARLNKSVRTFNRHFRQQTGMAFRDWRQQACLMYALTALREGKAITEVALSLGYEHPAAFTTMFRKTIGQAPAAFVRQMNGGPA